MESSFIDLLHRVSEFLDVVRSHCPERNSGVIITEARQMLFIDGLGRIRGHRWSLGSTVEAALQGHEDTLPTRMRSVRCSHLPRIHVSDPHREGHTLRSGIEGDELLIRTSAGASVTDLLFQGLHQIRLARIRGHDVREDLRTAERVHHLSRGEREGMNEPMDGLNEGRKEIHGRADARHTQMILGSTGQ